MRAKLRWLAATSAVGVLALVTPFSGCAGSGASPKDAGADSTRPSLCGDGVVETGEDCDLGSANGPAPCKSDCTWFCIPGTLNGDALCAPKDSCGGTSTCGPMHTCTSAMPLADGTSCGKDAGFLCVKQVCAPVQCGDGFVTPPEECDLGSNNGQGMGCDSSCKFDCVSSDPTRSCPSSNPCVGAGACDDTKHTCSIGTPKADGASCGAGQICKGGNCISPNCGDGVVEPGEECDFGASNGIGAGCETDCTFSCSTSPDSCVTPDACAGTNTCVAFTKGSSPGQHCVVGSPPATGTACAVGGMCSGQLCVSPNCGNGTVDPGEECDFGSAGNVHGSGCEPDCTFSCAPTSNSPNFCPGADVCSASPEVCSMVAGPNGGMGKKCTPGMVLAQCASCGGKDICVGNVCKGNTCGDGCVVAPETCDPPGAGCDAKCQKVVCGDGVRSGQEQCDDGNTANLDGCDSNCMFEQEQRSTALVLLGSTDSFCTVNALGAQAITAPGLGQIQAGISMDVASAVTNVIFKFMRAPGQQTLDLSGTSGSVVLGSLSGSVQSADAGAYDGSADLDWWYSVDRTMVDSQLNPLTTVPGTFANKMLTAGPGRLTILMDLAGSAARLDIWNVKIQASIGASSAPKSSSGSPPGHLSSENLDPTLTSFATSGVGASGPTAEMCGTTTSASLAGVAVPSNIALGGKFACDETYTTGTNTLLDALVRGCSIQGNFILNPTQPDSQDPSVSFPGGTKAPYKLQANAMTHLIDACVDSSSTPQSVPLATCLSGMGYTSAFTFQTDRVIVKH